MVWIARVVGALFVLALVLVAGFRIAALTREDQALQAVLPPEGQLVETSTGGIFVQSAGPEDGQPVLFAHGTGAWSGLWRPVLDRIGAEGYRAIGFDLPPFGFSARDPEGAYGRVRQAERIVALVDALRRDRQVLRRTWKLPVSAGEGGYFNLNDQEALNTQLSQLLSRGVPLVDALEVAPLVVAHSYGAGPAMEAVMRAPERFAGIVVVDGALGLGSHEEPGSLPVWLRSKMLREALVALTATNPLLTRTLLTPLIHRDDAATDAVIEVLQRPMMRQGSTEAFAEWLPFLLVPPVDALSTRAESYSALEVPVIYLWGDRDTVTPLAQGEELAALHPDARLVVLEDVGHIPQIEDEAGFTRALSEALETLAPRN